MNENVRANGARHAARLYPLSGGCDRDKARVARVAGRGSQVLAGVAGRGAQVCDPLRPRQPWAAAFQITEI